MGKRKDITGERFGRLTAIRPTEQEKCQSIVWECVCDCGKTCFVSVRNLTSSTGTRSCGCARSEKIAKRMRERKVSGELNPKFKHGMSKSRLYNTWINMKSRCYYKGNKRFDRYGGRGIKVCDEWLHDFVAFMEWSVANGYRDDLTIDRTDNDGPYSPDNCRWVSNDKQQSNTSHSRLISYHGKTQTLSEWSRELHISVPALQKRLKKWGVERAISEPAGGNGHGH